MREEQAKLEHGFYGACLRWGDERSSLELRRRRRKSRGKEEKWTASSGSYSSARSTRTRHAACSQCQREAKGSRWRAWKIGERTPAVGRWSATVPRNYIIATEFILQITLKFSKEVENLQKWKLLNFSNSTTLLQWTFSNSASILKFKFGVHLSIWIISKLLQILYVNFKNFEYQSWSL